MNLIFALTQTSTVMKTAGILSVVFLLTVGDLFPQAKFRKFPTSINHPAINVYAPYISAEGNSLVFISDNAEDYELTPFFTFRANGDWRNPQPFPKTIYTRLNFLRGFALGPDGTELYYTTLKSPGVGGYDIWTSDWNGAAWSTPENLGMPVNSKGHDSSPSVSADGKSIFFMRCESMDHDRAANCRILQSKKGQNGLWSEPVELPSYVNTGNSQTPRIMADGETLIFSSDRMPGSKGGMDLYVTTLIDGKWAAPTPLDFVNTEEDDQYVSANALGRYLLRDQMGTRKSEIVEHLFPDEVKPRSMMKIDGKIVDPDGKPVPAYVSVEDLTTGKRYYHARPDAGGAFTAFLREGSRYQLSVDPEQDHLTYYTRQFDLTVEKIPQVERLTATLKEPGDGDEIVLDMFTFKPYSSEVETTGSDAGLKRLMRLINSNPGLLFEIQVVLEGYRQDSVQSDPDLTEVTYDSVYTVYDDIDSLGQLYQRDTMLVDTIYHNDRTHRQAEALVQYFLAQGISENRLSFFANAMPAVPPEDRKLVLRAVLRSNRSE